MEYILTRVEKAVKLLPAEMAEEARQEAVRIIEDSSRSRDSWTGAERKALRALQTTTEHTIFPADKGNSTVVLNPVGYDHKLVPSSGTQLMKRLPRTPQRRSKAKPRIFFKEVNTCREGLQNTGSRMYKTFEAIWTLQNSYRTSPSKACCEQHRSPYLPALHVRI
jgi:hypothetical protein